jgi:hypothetical protein
MGAMMKRLRALRAISFSLFFLLSGFALAHAQAPPPEPTEAPSRLSMFVHDFTNWLDHIGTGADHHRANHLPPLPRPRPPGRASTPIASSQELSEFALAPVASKKKTPTPVQIND